MGQGRSRELGIDWRFIFPGRRAVGNGTFPSRYLFAVLWCIGCGIVVAVAGAFVLVLNTGSAYWALTYTTISKA